MRFTRFSFAGVEHLGVDIDGSLHGMSTADANFPGSLDDLIGDSEALAEASNILSSAPVIDKREITYLPPFAKSSKIICVGLNYRDHSAESGYAQPETPTVFARFTSGLVAHNAPIVRPNVSETLDYEGELVAVIGKPATRVSKENALDYVAGYSIFNDGSIREFQHATPQWTIGKNFDETGAFGPDFVTADALPKGCLGLKLETRLNGQIVQAALIDDMVFSVADLVSQLSQTMTLVPGDLIVTGTPSGVGAAHKPPLWMKPGDVCEVEIEKLGVLSNSIIGEAAHNTKVITA